VTAIINALNVRDQKRRLVMSLKRFFVLVAMPFVANTFCGIAIAQINPADPDAAQKQSSQPSSPAGPSDVQQQGSSTATQAVTQASPSGQSDVATGDSAQAKVQENAQSLWMVFPLLVLAGLCFAMFVGRRRKNVDGVMSAPAPGSKENPIIGKPTKGKPR
jgi:hypothetical protein